MPACRPVTGPRERQLAGGVGAALGVRTHLGMRGLRSRFWGRCRPVSVVTLSCGAAQAQNPWPAAHPPGLARPRPVWAPAHSVDRTCKCHTQAQPPVRSQSWSHKSTRCGFSLDTAFTHECKDCWLTHVHTAAGHPIVPPHSSPAPHCGRQPPEAPDLSEGWRGPEPQVLGEVF